MRIKIKRPKRRPHGYRSSGFQLFVIFALGILGALGAGACGYYGPNIPPEMAPFFPIAGLAFGLCFGIGIMSLLDVVARSDRERWRIPTRYEKLGSGHETRKNRETDALPKFVSKQFVLVRRHPCSWISRRASCGCLCPLWFEHSTKNGAALSLRWVRCCSLYRNWNRERAGLRSKRTRTVEKF